MSEYHLQTNARLFSLAQEEAKQMAECLREDGWEVVVSPSGDRIIYNKPNAEAIFIADFKAVNVQEERKS